MYISGCHPRLRQAYNGYKALGATDTRIELYANADSEKTTHFEVFKLQNTGRWKNLGVSAPLIGIGLIDLPKFGVASALAPLVPAFLKVCYFRKKIFMFSFEPNNQRNYFSISTLESKIGD